MMILSVGGRRAVDLVFSRLAGSERAPSVGFLDTGAVENATAFYVHCAADPQSG
ncbi:hypothetical protein [Pseudorhizobium pelagicum]|jgi:hypothetical protein|uniref:hypothetical protein n=1 Tax=Pseudorhizobium pelagicum TaxID=1509405 RepID=UPI001300C045|nr:hypothetical protein [Pseudorhizobium pelagicum]|tara:strand:- start:7680 stop:7841 length:162 start_codon:yes stop_codon:yes gene_type:complete